jgi:hypothetical protein
MKVATWYRFAYLSVRLPSCLCRVRSAHTAQPTARKTTANAVHLLLPAHAQDNVSEFDKKIENNG